MFKKILVPVDLAHLDRLQRALGSAAELSKLWQAPVVYVGVTTTLPSETSHTPEEFAERLDAFARDQRQLHGLEDATAKSYASHDPAIDLDDTLIQAVEETGADLVVIGSHKPGLKEHVFASNAGYMASHAPVSVMVVR